MDYSVETSEENQLLDSNKTITGDPKKNHDLREGMNHYESFVITRSRICSHW